MKIYRKPNNTKEPIANLNAAQRRAYNKGKQIMKKYPKAMKVLSNKEG